MQYNLAHDRGFVTNKPFRGKNPTPGAAISYYLKGAAPQVTVRIRDAAGARGPRAERQRPAERT